MTIRSSMSDGARKRSRRVLCRLTCTISIAAISAYFAAHIQIAGAQPLAGVKLAQFFPGAPQVPGANPVPGVPGVPGANGNPIERGKLPDRKAPDPRFPNARENFDKLKGAQTPQEYEEYEKQQEEERNRADEIQRQLSGERPPLDDVPGFDPNLRTREREVGGSPDPFDPRFQNDKGPGTVPGRGPAVGGQPNRGNGPVIVRDDGARSCGPADVATADEFIRDLATAARAAGYAPGTAPPNATDAAAQRGFEVAIGQEEIIQGRLMRELSLIQGNVARDLNGYLAAATAWQERYAYISSSTTYMQGMLAEWMEARAIYEKADFAFAMANLGWGLGKLGFKGIRYLTRTKTAAAAVQGTEATAAAVGAGRTAEAATGAAGTAQKGGAALAETQAFNKVIIPPGQNPAVLTRGGQLAQSTAVAVNTAKAGSGVVDDAARLAQLQASYDRDLAMTQRMLAQAKADGAPASLIQDFQTAVDDLLRTGRPTTVPPPPPSPLAQATAAIGDDIMKLAQEAGVDTSGPIQQLVGKADDIDAVANAEWEILRAVARARGWHDVPEWGINAIGRALLEGRRTLAGVEGAQISRANIEILRSLKTYVESQGLNFARWLETAGGELAVAGSKGEDVIEGIALYYDKADIDLILKLIDTGGDITQLRNAVGQVTQASLNGLARGTPGLLGGTCGTAADGVLVMNRGASAANLASPSVVASETQIPPVGAPPTDAQLQNVLYGTGQVGQVGLGNVVDQFGVTDRFTAGQGFGRAVMGELWELITSPSATVASHYYTFQIQSEYADLLQRDSAKLVDIGVLLDDAERALRNLQATLQNPTVTGPNSYLNRQGPQDLRKVLDDMQRAFNSGSDGWKRNNQDRMDDRRAHIVQKLADLAETMDDLQQLIARLGQVRMWLDSVRLGPDGRPKGPVDAFNPETFVRLGSISLYLRGIGADIFGLTQDTPFHMIPVANTPVPQGSNAGKDVDASPGGNWLREALDNSNTKAAGPR